MLRKELIGVLCWVLDYEKSDCYTVFFDEFCRSIDDAKDGGEISTLEAIIMQEDFYGKAD